MGELKEFFSLKLFTFGQLSLLKSYIYKLNYSQKCLNVMTCDARAGNLTRDT